MAKSTDLSAEDFKAKDPSGVMDVVFLGQTRLNESSGLAVSRVRPKHFWSHNDSGGKAHIYAFDWRGRQTGQIKLKSAEVVDWEDMASFTDHGIPRLLIADCGDNQASRVSITLHLFDEPDPTQSTSPKDIQTISVIYPDGPRDCEAVAVDEQRHQIVLISKSALPACGVYLVPLPQRVTKSTQATVTAKRIGTLPLPMVTAMDVDPSSGDIWVVSYFQAFRFRCADREGSIARQISALPEPHELPRWKQIESVAVDAANDIWVTSEGSPAPLGRLPQNHSPSSRRSARP